MQAVEMCNDYRLRQAPDVLLEAFSETRIPMHWADNRPSNLKPRDDIRIRDTAPIVRRSGEGVELAMVQWAWIDQRGKPVFNFRSEGRRFSDSARCLIPADGFYEFTAPPSGTPKRKLKDKWLFTLHDEPWFWIAGLVRNDCFTMLTTAPGPDVKPYHDRQVVVLPRREGLAWLDLMRPEGELLRPLPAGSLAVRRSDSDRLAGLPFATG